MRRTFQPLLLTSSKLGSRSSQAPPPSQSPKAPPEHCAGREGWAWRERALGCSPCARPGLKDVMRGRYKISSERNRSRQCAWREKAEEATAKGGRGELGGGRERNGWVSAEEKRRLLPETGQPGDGGGAPKAGQQLCPPETSSGALEKNSKGHSGASLEGSRSRRSSHRYGERRSSMNGQPQVRSRSLTRALPVESPCRLPPPKLPSGAAGLGARARR